MLCEHALNTVERKERALSQTIFLFTNFEIDPVGGPAIFSVREGVSDYDFQNVFTFLKSTQLQATFDYESRQINLPAGFVGRFLAGIHFFAAAMEFDLCGQL